MTGCVPMSLASLMGEARKIATLDLLARHYAIELSECCGEGNNNKQSRCPLPSHPKNPGNGISRSGKKLRWYCDPNGALRFWRCFNEICTKEYGHRPLGNDAIAFVAYMEGISREEATRRICDGFLSVPPPTST